MLKISFFTLGLCGVAELLSPPFCFFFLFLATSTLLLSEHRERVQASHDSFLSG